MYRHWVEEFVAAKTNAERRAVREEFQRLTGRDQHWFYRMLKENGWESGRKRRGDAGKTAQDDGALQMLASVCAESVRKNGKATMSVSDARSILRENGIEFAVGDSRLRELLRKNKMDVQSLSAPAPAQYMRSLRPNHVHMVDPSLCLVYYLPSGGQVVLRDDEVYKNKQFLPGKEHLKVWRYVMVDHYSGSLCVRYYQTAGENQANLWDFLLYAWAPKNDPLYAFHGLPEMLVWDCGSANTSRAITRALESLRIKVVPHMPGNPRAKGSVENGNNLVECRLESRLRFEPVETVEALNDLAERWCPAYNANAIDGLDCRIRRMGKIVGSRLSLWQRIAAADLRELPDEETCRLLLTVESVTRKLDGHLSFSFEHPRGGRRFYRLYDQPGVTVGMEVRVQPILTDDAPVVTAAWEYQGETIAVEVLPLEQDDAGFAACGAVYGEEYKRPQDTAVERNAKELKRMAYGTIEPSRKAVPFAGFNDGAGLKAHSFIDAAVDIKPARKIGKAVEVTQADVVSAYDIRVGGAEAAKRVKARAGYLPAGFLDWLRTEYPDGMTSAEIDALTADLVRGATAKIQEA